jgi:glycosyltransferase involved in cell wall biosynthesis
MKFVFVSYVASMGFNDPQKWLHRIGFYTGILEELALYEEVISIEQIDHKGALYRNGVKYHFLKFSSLGRVLPFKLHRYIKSLTPDVVMVQGTHFPLQVILLRLTLGKKPTVIVQNHAEIPLRGLKKIAQQLADRCTDTYTFTSKQMGLRWVELGNLARADKVNEVMEVSSVFKPTNNEAARSKTGVSGKPIFLSVGRLNANKDPLTVVQAFLRYAILNPEARLYMIYQTDELLNDIKSIIESHPYKANIVLVGKVEHADLLYWFNSADFIISGSHYEGSGVAVCEAMSCGCIPIVTDIDSFIMMTDHGKCGILYKAGDQEALLLALYQTSQFNMREQQAAVLAYYNNTLSFKAIAGRLRAIAAGLSK